MTTQWRDGMGRLTVKTDTGAARSGEFVMAPPFVGVCRRPGWLIVQGVWVGTSIIGHFDDTALRERARRRHRNHHAPAWAHDNGSIPTVDDLTDDLDT